MEINHKTAGRPFAQSEIQVREFRRNQVIKAWINNLNILSVRKLIANFGFVVLFPGFLFYQLYFAYLNEPFPPILSGLFGPTSFIIFCFYCLDFVFTFRYLNKYSIVFFLFIYYSAGIVIANWIFNYGWYVSVSVAQSVQAIVMWAALFYIGSNFPKKITTIYIWYAMSAALIFLSLLGFYLITGNLMFYAKLFFGSENVATYQEFARSAFIIFVFLVSFTKSSLRSYAWMASGLFVMFILGARSEFAAYLIVCSVYLFFDKGKLKNFIILIIPLLLLLFVSVDDFSLGNSRQFNLFNLDEDESWSERDKFNNIGLDQIKQNFIFGDFGGHIKATGNEGGYAHNLLSAWVSFGLIGFIMYVSMTIFAVFGSAKFIFSNSHGNRNLIVFSTLLNFSNLILIIASKSVYWPVVALGWGVFSSIKKGQVK